MTTRKVQNPNQKGNSAFLWALLAVVAIALLVIGIIVYNGRNQQDEALQQYAVDTSGINIEWSEGEDVIHLTGKETAADAKTADYFEDFSCSHCADLHIASDEAMMEKLEAGEIKVDLRPMTALDRGTEGHSTRALAAELALLADGDFDAAFSLRDYLFRDQAEAYKANMDNAAFADKAAVFGASDTALQDIRDGKFIEVAKKMGDDNQKFQNDTTGESWTPRVLIDGKDVEDINPDRDSWPQTLADL